MYNSFFWCTILRMLTNAETCDLIHRRTQNSFLNSMVSWCCPLAVKLSSTHNPCQPLICSLSLSLWSFFLSRMSYAWYFTMNNLLILTYFTKHNAFTHVVVYTNKKMLSMIPLHGWIILFLILSRLLQEAWAVSSFRIVWITLL